MKRSTSFLFLFIALCALCAQGQELKLKKGQKLEYEVLDMTDYGTNLSLSYGEVNFLVNAVTKDGYLITVSKPRSLEYNYNRIIVDSRLPLSAQPKTYDAISNHISATLSYQITASKNGEILKAEGFEQLKEKALSAIRQMNATEKWMSREDYVNSKFNEVSLKAEVKRFLSLAPVQHVDTLKTGTERYAVTTTTNGITKKDSVFSTDTMMVRKNMGRELKTGLLISSLDDSTSNSLNTRNGEKSYYRLLHKVNLKKSNFKALGFGPLLFEEFKKGSDYDNYFSPSGEAAQKVLKMNTDYSNTKGKLGVKDSMLKVLDTLDQQMKETDYQYWAAKAQLIGRMGMDHKPLIRKIPYEYLPTAYYVMLKLECELRENYTENLSKAVQLGFGKFSKGRNYPLNMHMMVGALHDEWAKFAFQTRDKTALSAMLKSIDETEKLNFPRFNAMLGGLKTYIQVKLADDNSRLAALVSSNTSASYDKYGRYRLLVYDELSNRGVADSIRMTYINLTIDKLKQAVLDSNDFAKSLRPVQRKYLGDAYYRKSQLMGGAGISYLQMAADYIPSQQDKIQNNWDLEPEYVYLPFKAYNELFMERAESAGGSKETILEKYAELVIIEPERYQILKEKYLKSYPSGNFKTWFGKILKSKLPSSPAFTLLETSGKKIGSTENRSKFIFIDFWGTWCGACISEIHKIEELHKNNNQPEKLMVTTIACHDKIQYVDDFMAKKKYTYQVLMSDNLVERRFNVQHYPTKLLLLPIGAYIVVPDTENYKALVDKYMEWDI